MLEPTNITSFFDGKDGPAGRQSRIDTSKLSELVADQLQQRWHDEAEKTSINFDDASDRHSAHMQARSALSKHQ